MKLLSILKSKYTLIAGSLLLFFNKIVFAAPGDDPFPQINIQGGNVVQATGTQMESGMKYSLVGSGILMILIGIGVIIHRLREDTNNKESGNFVTTMIMAAVAITVGIILIAIAWAASSYKAPQNP